MVIFNYYSILLAMSLWLRHASSTIENITPNQKTGVEQNIITVVNWCKNHRNLSGMEYLGVAEELYKMLNAQVEMLLDSTYNLLLFIFSELEGKPITPLPTFVSKLPHSDNLLDDKSDESKDPDDEELDLDLEWLDQDDEEYDEDAEFYEEEQSQLIEPVPAATDPNHLRQKQIAKLVQESFTTFVCMCIYTRVLMIGS